MLLDKEWKDFKRMLGDLEEESRWLRGPACKAGAHPTIYHHEHMIGPAKWHCHCGEVASPAKSRFSLSSPTITRKGA